MRLVLLIALCFYSSLLPAQESVRETVEQGLLQYESLDRNPQLVLLEGLLEKSTKTLTSSDTTLAKVYNALGQWHLDGRDYAAALDYYDEAEAILTQADKPALLAHTLTDKSDCLFHLIRLKDAEKAINKSIDINKDLENGKDYKNYMLLAKIFYSQGNYNLQVNYATYALDVADTPQEKCEAYYEIFRGNIWLDNKSACDQSIDKQLQLSKTYGLAYHRGAAYFCLAWQKAEQARSSRYAFKSQIRAVNNDKTLSEQQIIDKKAIINSERQDLQISSEAIKYYDKAISFFLKSDNDKRHDRISYCYSGMGIQYEKIGLPDFSIQYAKLAVSESNKFYGQDYKPGTAIHYHNLAVRYIRNNDLESGIRQLQNAIKCKLDNPEFSDVRQVIPKEDFYGVSLKWDLLTSIKDKALCYARLYLDHKNIEDAVNAERHMCNALELIDVMRAELSTDDAKVFWRRKTRSYYNDIIEISNWLGDDEKVHRYMEKSRSLLLLDELNHQDALGLIPAELAERERDLRKIFSSNTERKDHSSYEKYTSFLDSLRDAYPHYYEYKFQVETPSIKEIQENLVSDSSQIVQYHLTRDSLFIHSITRQGTELFHTRRPRQLRSQIKRMNILLGNKDSLEYKDSYNEFLEIASNLYGVLLDSLSHNAKQLIILGDGPLNNLSFDSLVKGRKQNGDPLYLIEEHVISIAPSLSVLMKLKDKKDFDNLLLVSPERFQDMHLSAMVQSTEEIEMLSTLSNTKTLRAEEATFANFVAASSDFDVIHFSSHSGLDSLNNPWIAFHDTKVPLKEIYKLNLDASLVTLSSCRSTDGESFAGEGLNSLARAFLFVDASAVIGSNWDLNESAGLEVLGNFYKGLKDGMSKPEALRSAKLKYMQANPYKSPYYWAPLIVIGNPGALESGHQQSHFGLILLFIGFLALGFLIKKFI